MDTRHIHTFAALMLLAPTLAGCATTSDATGEPPASLTGTASDRERIAPPPNAVFVATLEDSSRAPPASAAPSATPLEGTTWKLTGLGTQPIETAESRPEPHLTLDAAQNRIAGSGGCNRFMGSYRLDGDSLSFGGVAGTLMACTDGMEQERAFLSSLEHVTTYRIAGKRLDLLNANGETVAQFEAKAAP